MDRLNWAPIKAKSGQGEEGHLAEISVSVSFPRRFITRVREGILVCGFFQVVTLPNLLSSLRRQQVAPPDPGTAPCMGS